MHILFITDSTVEGASFRYRIHQYLGFLEAEGFSCTVAHPREFTLARIRRLRRYDIVYIQKRLLSVPWVFAASLAARRLMFDFDDAIWTCPDHDWKPLTRRKVERRLQMVLSKAACVTVGNSYLAEYASRYCRDVVVIPTCLDTDYYRPPEAGALPKTRLDEEGLGDGSHEPVRLGWIGSRPNLIYLEGLEPVFRRLADSGVSVELVVVCNREYRSPSLRTDFIPWSLKGELDALWSFDIGIMPLHDDDWTRGKCGFKTIQYMACGLPSVSSPVGVNSEIVQDGVNSFLASDEDEWVEKLSRLIADFNLRVRIGNEGRRTVEEKYSIGVGVRLLADTLRRVGSS